MKKTFLIGAFLFASLVSFSAGKGCNNKTRCLLFEKLASCKQL